MTRSTEEWVTRMALEKVPCAPVLARRNMLDHEQITASKIIREYEHHRVGKIRQASSPSRFSKTRLEFRFGAPMLGEHTQEILEEAGIDKEDISELLVSKIVAC